MISATDSIVNLLLNNEILTHLIGCLFCGTSLSLCITQRIALIAKQKSIYDGTCLASII